MTIYENSLRTTLQIWKSKLITKNINLKKHLCGGGGKSMCVFLCACVCVYKYLFVCTDIYIHTNIPQKAISN